MWSELVGSKVAVIVITLRVEGLSEHLTVYEFAGFAALFLHPGNTLPAVKKVIRPATEEVIEITFACRYTKSPDGIERVAVAVLL